MLVVLMVIVVLPLRGSGGSGLLAVDGLWLESGRRR